MTKLIPQWRQLWKFYSTHALVLATMVPIGMDEAFKYIGHEVPMCVKIPVGAFILISGLIGRSIVQVPVDNPTEDKQDDQDVGSSSISDKQAP